MPDLGVLGWLTLGFGALVIGMSKTALPGSAAVSVALFAAVLPARQSTGTILLLLILADVFALLAYRRHVNWRALVRLAPAVAAGLVLGALFLAVANDAVVKRGIAVLLLVVIAVTLLRRRARQNAQRDEPRRLAAAVYGTLGGFTTMVANAAGPVMSMYFIASRFSVKEFLGTAAWFYALVNVSKLPFSIGLGLITPSGLLIDLVLAPLVVVSALAGRYLAARLDQVLFERLVIGFTIAGALYLLV